MMKNKKCKINEPLPLRKFELDLFEVKEISFLLYSWDPQYKHKLCYKGLINLSNLNLEQNSQHSLALKMDGRGKGTLYLKMIYSELKICYARKPLSTNLFGGELELIVAKENSGLNVPLIVKKCVEEIELRGMDLIGMNCIFLKADKKVINLEDMKFNLTNRFFKKVFIEFADHKSERIY